MKYWIGFWVTLLILFVVFITLVVTKSIETSERYQDICSENNMKTVRLYRTLVCVDDEGRMFYLR